MSESADNAAPTRGGVLGPTWEDELRAGQEAEGGAGSVDAELAIVHLLRHAAGPERLGEARLDVGWAEVEAEIAPVPWWRQAGVRWGTGALAAAAAAAVIVVVWPGDRGGDPLSPEDDLVAAVDTAATLEAQFAVLEPAAREAIDEEVDTQRGQERSALLAMAGRADQSAGGAP